MTTAGDFSSPPYSADSRASGLLLHVTSLPSPYGIGDLGAGAFSWIDRLYAAGQRWWQALPVGPTGYGNSPYQSLSSFAGNALLVSPGELIADELLDRADMEEQVSNETIDYGRVIPAKNRLIEIAWTNFKKGRREDLRPAYEQFCQQEAHWLDDYALFRALKVKYNGASYLDWPADLVERKPKALASASHELTSIIDPLRLAPLLLQPQAHCGLHHAHARGDRFSDELPCFGCPDSSNIRAP